MDYFLNYTENLVELWSSGRLQFEPKGWMREMRDKLKYYLRSSLKSMGNSYLHAIYSSESDKNTSFDIENILFYNVGVDYFKNLANKGVFFERILKKPPVLNIDGTLIYFNHYMKYKILNSYNQASNYWEKDKTLVRWSDSQIKDLKTTLSLDSIWLSMSECKIIEMNSYKSGSLLGIKINLNIPVIYESYNFNFITILKSLLDGIISSFHTHDGKNLNEIVQRLSNRSGICLDKVKTMLINNKKAVLGEKELIWLWSNSIQWNPSDDLLFQGEIDINYLENISIIQFEGELFSIKRTLEN